VLEPVGKYHIYADQYRFYAPEVDDQQDFIANKVNCRDNDPAQSRLAKTLTAFLICIIKRAGLQESKNHR